MQNNLRDEHMDELFQVSRFISATAGWNGGTD